jgi:hypothetical protein
MSTSIIPPLYVPPLFTLGATIIQIATQRVIQVYETSSDQEARLARAKEVAFLSLKVGIGYGALLAEREIGLIAFCAGKISKDVAAKSVLVFGLLFAASGLMTYAFTSCALPEYAQIYLPRLQEIENKFNQAEEDEDKLLTTSIEFLENFRPELDRVKFDRYDYYSSSERTKMLLDALNKYSQTRNFQAPVEGYRCGRGHPINYKVHSVITGVLSYFKGSKNGPAKYSLVKDASISIQKKVAPIFTQTVLPFIEGLSKKPEFKEVQRQDRISDIKAEIVRLEAEKQQLEDEQTGACS